MIKLKNILEGKIDNLAKSLKLSTDDVTYLKSLNIDPKFHEWITIQYAKDKNQFKEDIGRYKEAIQLFIKNKDRIKSDYLKHKQDPNYNIIQIRDNKSNEYLLNVDYRDILNIKSLHDLESITSHYEVKKSKNAEIKDIKEGAEKVFEDSNWLIVHVKTEEASCYYGANTKWCTAGETNNMFNNYNQKGPLIIIIDKKENQKYQLNYNKNPNKKSNMLTDYKDDDLNYNTFQHLYIPLKIIYKKYLNRELNLESLYFDYVEFYNSYLHYNTETELYDISSENFIITDDFIHNGKLAKNFGECINTVNIECINTSIKTLQGMPMHVTGDFLCSGNSKLESLDGMPQYIDKTFNLSNNYKLKNLNGMKNLEVFDFYCANNKLESLVGAQSATIKNKLTITNNNNIQSLIGFPSKVNGDFICNENKLLSSLTGVQCKIQGSFICENNPNLTEIKNIPNASFYIVSKKIEEDVKNILEKFGKSNLCISLNKAKKYINNISYTKVDHQYTFSNMPPIDVDTSKGVLFLLEKDMNGLSYNIATDTITITKQLNADLRIFSLISVNNKINQKFENMKYLFINDLFYIYNHAGNIITKKQSIIEFTYALQVYGNSMYDTAGRMIQDPEIYLDSNYINQLPTDIKNAYIVANFPNVYGKDVTEYDYFNINVSEKIINYLKNKVKNGYPPMSSDYYTINNNVVNLTEDLSAFDDYDFLFLYIIANTPLVKIKKSQLKFYAPPDVNLIKKFNFELV